MSRFKQLLSGSNEPLVMESTSLFALAALLTLVQLPHVLNLPIWVSLFGIGIIALRVYARGTPNKRAWRYLFSSPAVTTVAIVGALLIRLHYGYFLGRDPCVAFLFLLVSLKFAEYRRSADATLLLGLACVLMLTQYFYSQSIIAAVVTLPAVFALGHALAVLRDPSHAMASKPQLRLIGKLLLQGLPIAILLFVLFPRLPGPLWSMPDDASAQTGLSDTMNPGDIGNLSQSNEVAFRVEFDGAVPAPDARYWRGPVLTRFDGYTWSPEQKVTHAVPAEEVPGASEYTVMLQPHKNHWLFALDQAVSIPRKDGSVAAVGTASNFATLTSSGQLLAKDPVTRVTRYTQRSNVSSTFQAPVKPTEHELAYPGNMPRTVQLAAEISSQSDSASDYVQRVLARFNQMDYRYTLKPGLLGDTPVDEFLFDTRQGFCEHYASAFTLLMRAAGIPARVVTGYLGGEMNDDYMIVRQSDAHAWSEVYIDGVWQRFDPTGAVAPSRVERGLSAALPQGELTGLRHNKAFSWTNKLALAWDSVNHDWQRLIVDYNNKSQDGLMEKLGLPTMALWQIALFILGTAGLWALWMLRSPLQRNRKKLSTADTVWKKVEKWLNTQNITRDPSETPQAFLDRACHELQHVEKDLRAIGDLLLPARFAPLSETVAVQQARSAESNLAMLVKKAAAK